MRAKTFATSLFVVLIVAAVASLWAVASPTSASCAAAFTAEQVAASPGDSAAFVDEVNRIRASKGLGALVVDSNLSAVAQEWAQHIGEAQAASHRPNLAAGITINWRVLGENVGASPTVSEMMRAFVNSATHYDNIVNASFTRIGIGTVRAPDGMLYSAHEFASVRTPAPARVVPQQRGPAVAAVAPSTSTTTVTTVVTETVEAPPSTAPDHVFVHNLGTTC
jgi:hypothetical protein